MPQTETTSHSSHRYESLLSETGGFGRYQWMVLIMYALNTWFFAANQMFMVFGAKEPEITCFNETIKQQFLQNEASQLNLTESCDVTNTFFSVVSEWNLVQGPRRYIASTITTVQFIGVLFGPMVFGMLSDHYGRRITLIVGSVILTGSNIIRCFSISWQMFAVCSFFVGFSCTAIQSTVHIYFIEHCPARHRMLFTITGWVPGSILFGVFAYLTRHWQLLIMSSLTFGIPGLVLAVILRPSPKWHLSKGNTEKALEILTQIANFNKVGHFDSGLVQDELDDLNQETISDTTKDHQKYDYRHLFYTRKMALATIAIAVTWIASLIVFYGIAFGMQHLYGDLYTNFFISSIIGVVPSLICRLVDVKLKWFTRRHMLLTGLAIQTTAMVAIVVVIMTEVDKAYPVLVTIAALTGVVGTAVIWLPTELVCPEFYPTELRTMGYAFAIFVSRFSILASPHLMQLKYIWIPGPYVAFLSFSALNLVVAWFWFPETKNMELQDMNTIIKNAKSVD